MRKLREQKDDLNMLFCLAGEMVSMKGEDSYAYASCGDKTLISVFDGCGGSGSRRYENYVGSTGAYVASRAVAGAVSDWFSNTNGNMECLPEYVARALNVCDSYGDKTGRLIGSLGLSFPTTAAGMVIDVHSKKTEAECFWAGDSRCYLLDDGGLHQLSRDDIDCQDAYQNLSGDGALTNVINVNGKYTLNRKKVTVKMPCVLFAATDGCFAYMKTPMEFEYVILETLLRSDNIEAWKMNLNAKILEFAGDDHTLCLAAFGFDDFTSVKRYFVERAKMMYSTYMQNNRDEQAGWKKYERDYYKYL